MASLSAVTAVAAVLQASPATPRAPLTWRVASAGACGGGRGRPTIHLAGRAAPSRAAPVRCGHPLPRGVRRGNREEVQSSPGGGGEPLPGALSQRAELEPVWFHARLQAGRGGPCGPHLPPWLPEGGLKAGSTRRLNHCARIVLALYFLEQNTMNHCARIVFCSKRRDHVSPLLKQLNWPTFDDLITERDVAMIFRAMHHRRAPDALRDTIVYRRDVTARDTRGALTGLLQPPRVRRELARRFFTYRATSAWNRSPSEVRDAVTTRGCRRAVQAWLRGSDER